MSDSRDRILSAIRASLERGPLAGQAAAALEDRLASAEAALVPQRGRPEKAARADRFIAEAERVDATTARVADFAAVAGAVAAFLAANNLPTTLKVAPEARLENIPWSEQPLLSVTYGKAEDTDPVSVTGAMAGVAETGTLILLSGPDSPTTLNFLPDTHIVVLAASSIESAYEDVWKRLRAGAGNEGFMPRVVNLITGPSRTGDIEQTLQLGVHGPRRLHIVLVDDQQG